MKSQNAHKVRCDYDEAIELLRHMTLDVMYATRDVYKKAYDSTNSDDYKWNFATGLLGVYALGFLSGARAVREKNVAKESRKKGG